MSVASRRLWWAALVISAATLVGIVIGRRRRALHDVAAGTLVASDVAIAHVE